MKFEKDGIVYEFKLANYGQKREVNETPEEKEIFDIIKDVLNNAGYDTSGMELVRKSDNYVTSLFLDWDLARFKFTQKAKWIRIPYYHIGSDKFVLDAPETVRDFADILKEAADHSIKWRGNIREDEQNK